MTRFADDLETPGGSIGPQLVFYFVYAGDQKAIVLYSGGGRLSLGLVIIIIFIYHARTEHKIQKLNSVK